METVATVLFSVALGATVAALIGTLVIILLMVFRGHNG